MRYALTILALLLTTPAWAVTFPEDAKTSADKIEYCYILQTELINNYNDKGKDFREGKMSEKDWTDFRDWHDITQGALTNEITEQKKALRASTRFKGDINDI